MWLIRAILSRRRLKGYFISGSFGLVLCRRLRGLESVARRVAEHRPLVHTVALQLRSYHQLADAFWENGLYGGVRPFDSLLCDNDARVDIHWRGEV
jgi:hypothetical protein